MLALRFGSWPTQTNSIKKERLAALPLHGVHCLTAAGPCVTGLHTPGASTVTITEGPFRAWSLVQGNALSCARLPFLGHQDHGHGIAHTTISASTHRCWQTLRGHSPRKGDASAFFCGERHGNCTYRLLYQRLHHQSSRRSRAGNSLTAFWSCLANRRRLTQRGQSPRGERSPHFQVEAS